LIQIPYDTGKVKIGLTYVRPLPPHTPEDDWAQSILLGDKQGLSEEAVTCIQSLIVIALMLIGVFVLGGFKNA
jgi:hypothetical protein